MKKTNLWQLLGCALMCVGTSSEVVAVETANATLGNFQIQVLSLGPGGGSVSLANSGVSYYAYDGVAYKYDGIYSAAVGTALDIAYPGSATFSGSASITEGDPFSTTGGPSAFAAASANLPGTYMTSYADLMLGQFVIGPKTQVVFTATASVDVSASSLNANDFAVATMQISDATGFDIVAWDYSLIYTEFDGRIFDLRKPTLRVTLNNDSDVDLTRYAFIGARASIVLSPVPEPPVSALALLGLCALGFRARKRTSVDR